MAEQWKETDDRPITEWKITDDGELFVSVDNRPWLRIFVYTTGAALEKMADRPMTSDAFQPPRTNVEAQSHHHISSSKNAKAA